MLSLVLVEPREALGVDHFGRLQSRAAVFADAGRTWGDDPLGGENLGWLRDVGFGLRLAPTRFGTDKVFHIDVAFPLDGDDSIDSVQFLIEAKRSF